MATVHVFNIDLVKEYFATCGEYFALVKKPFQTIPFKKIWGCNQSNWEDAFRTWGAFQVWLAGIVITLSNIIVIASFPEYIGSAIFNIIYGIGTAYLWAHLGWFSVIKKDGCCCLCVVCCTGGKVFILLWGCWCVFWGLMTVISALTYLGYGGAAAIAGILYIVYAISWVYMGVCLIRVWQAKGSEVTPAKITAVVPEGLPEAGKKQEEQQKEAAGGNEGATGGTAEASPPPPKKEPVEEPAPPKENPPAPPAEKPKEELKVVVEEPAPPAENPKEEVKEKPKEEP